MFSLQSQVFIPAITGHVPDEMVQCIVALLDFTYLARRPAHDSDSLTAMDEALERFHALRGIFVDVQVRDENFALPRQHSLVHYVRSIKLFGSPNGLCSSITENKHIYAVKRPWRASSRNNPLHQILLKNTRLLKISSARSEFGRRGMLAGDVLSYNIFGRTLDAIEEEGRPGEREGDDDDDEVDNAEESDTVIELGSRAGVYHFTHCSYCSWIVCL